MTTASQASGDYDAYASQYAVNVAWREQGGVDGDPFGLLPPLLELLGDITGCRVLDAGCGEGYLARVLAARGARVTGIWPPGERGPGQPRRSPGRPPAARAPARTLRHPPARRRPAR